MILFIFSANVGPLFKFLTVYLALTNVTCLFLFCRPDAFPTIEKLYEHGVLDYLVRSSF